MINFFIGLLIGCLLGVSLMALFSMAGKDDYDG